MSNINKSIFILLTITCRYTFGDTECSHYYIPMIEDKFGPYYFMEPANVSQINLDDISDIGVPRNCILSFDCLHIENEFCERPLVPMSNKGKHEFIGSNDKLIPIKTKELPTTTMLTNKKVEQLTTSFSMTVGEETFATTPILVTAVKEEPLAKTPILMTIEEEPLATTPSLTTTVKEEPLAKPLMLITMEKEPLATTPNLTTVKEEPLTKTPMLMTIEEESIAKTPILTTEEEESLAKPLMLITMEEEPLATTPNLTTIKEEPLIKTPMLMTIEEESIAKTPMLTTMEEEPLAKTPTLITAKQESLSTTSPTIEEQLPVNISNGLGDNYLIKISGDCKLNVSVFIKKNGCKVNSEDGENGILTYDCENLSIDDCNVGLESKDLIDIDKINETICMNYTVIMKESSSDTGYILQLSSETERESLNITNKNACILTIACNNDTHIKCKPIESKYISKSNEFLHTASNPVLYDNIKGISTCVNSNKECKSELMNLEPTTPIINTNQETGTTSIQTLLELNRTILSNNENCSHDTINCEKSRILPSVTVNAEEGNVYNTTGSNDIDSKSSTSTENNVPSTTSYNEDIKNDDVITENTINNPETTTALNIDTTFGTTVNYVSINGSKYGFIKDKNEQENILPIVTISFGSVAILTCVYLLVTKCITISKSGEYCIQETIGMNQGFTAC